MGCGLACQVICTTSNLNSARKCRDRHRSRRQRWFVTIAAGVCAYAFNVASIQSDVRNVLQLWATIHANSLPKRIAPPDWRRKFLSALSQADLFSHPQREESKPQEVGLASLLRSIAQLSRPDTGRKTGTTSSRSARWNCCALLEMVRGARDQTKRRRDKSQYL